MPTMEEVPVVKKKFHNIGGFPNVIGTIDCTHVQLESLDCADREIYRNRKGTFSINVQTISDANLKIRDIVARWPGSTHDSTIFHSSRIRASFESGLYENCFLLGDSGYALKRYLLTPYLHPQTEVHERYNRSHIKTRNTVERQYGLLKRRFPALRNGMRLKLETSMAVIVACAILHNICIEQNEASPTEEHQDEDNMPILNMVENAEAASTNLFRDLIANQFFS